MTMCFSNPLDISQIANPVNVLIFWDGTPLFREIIHLGMSDIFVNIVM